MHLVTGEFQKKPMVYFDDYDDGSEDSERSKDWDTEPGDDRWEMYEMGDD